LRKIELSGDLEDVFLKEFESLHSGEGVVVRADKKGEIKVVGFTPIPRARALWPFQIEISSTLTGQTRGENSIEVES
jgi:hypothetical protein